jgi:flagellar basal-body rod protein FlgF
MNPLLYQSYSAVAARFAQLTVLSNNLANTNTVGYKGDRLFEEIVQYSTKNIAEADKADQVTGIPVTRQREVTDFSPGSILETGNPLNIAITGNGFFVVQSPQGKRYTRQGDFQINTKGQLLSADGLPVLGEQGPITLPAGQVYIDDSGHVSVDGQEIERLKLVDFNDRTKLAKEGNGRFVLTDDSETEVPATSPNLKQGALESSNVNPVRLMAELLDTRRQFEAMQKSIQLSMNEMTLRLIDQTNR